MLARFVRCSDADVEAERGVVMEEWRQGRTAHGRADEDYVTTLMRGSLYAERLPIGKVCAAAAAARPCPPPGRRPA